LYEKFLKNKTYTNEKKYKHYKKYYYSNQLENAECNAKKTWDTMKEIIGNVKTNTNQLPKQLNYKNKINF